LNVRDIEVIDCELRLLAAFRRMAREGKGRPPSTARIDELLDERSAAILLSSTACQAAWAIKDGPPQ
jgi:hypothetical protein